MDIMRKGINPKLAALLRQIPYGMVSTYKELAKAMDTNPRAVSRMLAGNRDLDNVPCYKIVMSDGSIGGYVLGRKEKIRRLKKEGIKICNKQGKIFKDKEHCAEAKIKDFKKVLFIFYVFFIFL